VRKHEAAGGCGRLQEAAGGCWRLREGSHPYGPPPREARSPHTGLAADLVAELVVADKAIGASELPRHAVYPLGVRPRADGLGAQVGKLKDAMEKAVKA
jgi:hypothetical protein